MPYQNIPSEVQDYFASIKDETKVEALIKLRETIISALPEGYEEGMQYNLPSFFVPLSTYPDGYHVKKGTPLPFISYAAQKNHIALYHMAIYADPKLLSWFKLEYVKSAPTKLDMGKSCIRWKKPQHIPYSLVSQLISKVTIVDWIALYRKSYVDK